MAECLLKILSRESAGNETGTKAITMVTKIFTALFFIFFALTALLHVPLGGVVLAVVALIAGIAWLVGA